MLPSEPDDSRDGVQVRKAGPPPSVQQPDEQDLGPLSIIFTKIAIARQTLRSYISGKGFVDQFTSHGEPS